MKKEQWINEVYKLLCKSQGEPANDTEKANLRSWAESLAENYFVDGYTPEDAHEEEMSYSD